jgi:hypothetical protein
VQGVLLDCYKIRRTGFLGLSTNTTCRPYDYQADLSIPNVTSESSKPAPAEMSVSEQIEELFLHNKNPLRILNDNSSTSNPHLRLWYLKAKALENANIAQEMLMKNGPPPTPEPSVSNDDNGDNGGDGPEDGGWNDPGDDFNYGRLGPPWIQRDGNHDADGSDYGDTNEDWGTSGDDAYNDADDNEHDQDDRDSYWSGEYSDREDEGYAHDGLPDNTVEENWNLMEPRAGRS